MLYFVILPAVVAFLVLLLAGALIAYLVPGWRGATGYFVGGAVGSACGFIIANAALILLVMGTIQTVDHLALPDLLKSIGTIGSAAVLFIGPIFASGLGILLGLTAGVLLVLLRRRRRAI